MMTKYLVSLALIMVIAISLLLYFAIVAEHRTEDKNGTITDVPMHIFNEKPAKTLIVKVTDKSGNPINGCKLDIKSESGYGELRELIGDAFTDEQGLYRKEGVEYDKLSLISKIIVRAEAEGYVEDNYHFDAASLDDNPMLIELEKGYTLQGHISGFAEGDEKYIHISFIYSANNLTKIMHCKVDSSGDFCFDNMPPKDVELTVSHSRKKYLDEDIVANPLAGPVNVHLKPNPKFKPTTK